MAAFNSMIFRLCKLPLSIENYINELKYVKKIANINGFSEDSVNKLVCKHSRNIKRQQLTTFYNYRNDNTKKYAIFNFSGDMSLKLKHIFKQHNINLVFSNNFKIYNMLSDFKDKTENQYKSGIYKISCGNKNCSLMYIGQTKRAIIKRFKEHSANIKHNQPDKSAVALHALELDHFNITSDNNLKLLKQVNNNRKLNAWESLHLHKNRCHLMNTDRGQIQSPLFYYT